MKNTQWLAVIVVLQGMILAGQWLGPSVYVAPAGAQIPDSGAQRMQMIDELRSANAKLEKITALLESGKLQVHAVMPDDKKQ
jgi:hypothetical protein